MSTTARWHGALGARRHRANSARYPRGQRGGRDQRGASAVEFGLVAIPLLTLLIGIIQFSIWFWAYQVGAHAAREGARVAAVNPCATAAVHARIQNRMGSADSPGTLVIGGPTSSVSPAAPGGEVTVTLTFDVFEIGLFPMPGVTKSATARIENVPAGSGC
jgi:hypothetical protein